MTTTLDQIKALNVDGVFLSNGPGDPAAMVEVVELVQKHFARRDSIFWYLLRPSNFRSEL